MTALVVAGRRLAGARSQVRSAVPPLTGGRLLARTVLVMVLLVSGGLLAQVVLLSSLQQRAAQQRLFDRFRSELAQGTAPVGPTDSDGALLRMGSPVAYLEIPAIGLRQVVVEGTTGSALVEGPGHRRDTPLPGQVGVSVVFGRSTAYGRPFGRIEELERGDRIHATTGQGEFTFEVTGVRRDGDPLPAPPSAGDGRIVLATADGSPFLPDGVLRADAEVVGKGAPGSARPFSAASLPANENALAVDTSRLWSLALWLELLLVLAIGAVWTWRRWGRAQTWVVFLPPVVLVGVYVTNNTTLLLPNLL